MAKPIAGDRIVDANDSLVIDHIAQVIRSMESGSNYTAINKGHNTTNWATGAYQILNSTWKGWSKNVAGASSYPSAYQAPSSIQDAVAKAQIRAMLTAHNNQLAAVPVGWYYPAAWGNDAILDKVPAPSQGNTMTVRQYAEAWIKKYDSWTGFEGDVQTVSEGRDSSRSVFDPLGIFDAAGNVAAGIWGTVTSPLDALKTVLAILTSGEMWMRIVKVIGGLVAIGMGFAVITGKAALETVAAVK